MDNQHRQIKGYKELDQKQIDTMNRIKSLGAEVGSLIDELIVGCDADSRWIAIGKTNLQQGFMALTRSVTKPDFF